MIVAAPFLGEFGWLVAVWVPWLRHRIRSFHANADVTVLCEPGQEFLFADMATKVEPVAVKVTRRDCQNAWVEGVGPMKAQSYYELVRSLHPRTPKARLISPSDIRVSWPPGECPQLKESLHHAYFEGAEHVGGRVGFHVRHCKDKQPERNWKVEDAEDLVTTLRQSDYEVFAFGHPSDSLCPRGAHDLRGVSVETTCKGMASCVAVIGPSSGPLHLANYCLTPVVWWSQNRKDIARYERHWNPFHLLNRRVGETWHPSMDDVLLALHEVLHVVELWKEQG